MYTHWILVLLVFGYIGLSKCSYRCTMDFLKVTCSQIRTQEMADEMFVILKKADLSYLNITKSNMPTVSASAFTDFTNLDELYITGSQIEVLEDGAFAHCSQLKYLFLSNNRMERFNVKAFNSDNILIDLDLSNNLLNSLDDFNISHFPKLKILNLTNNFLTILPRCLPEKLLNVNDFYVLVDNNPWECNNVSWLQNLSSKIYDAFCLNSTFDYTPNSNEILVLSDGTDTICKDDDWTSYILCFFGALVLGLLLGCSPLIYQYSKSSVPERGDSISYHNAPQQDLGTEVGLVDMLGNRSLRRYMHTIHNSFTISPQT